jgi:hypothetical protein
VVVRVLIVPRCMACCADLSTSFFVGDSIDGGDEGFAKAIGIKFQMASSVFGWVVLLGPQFLPFKGVQYCFGNPLMIMYVMACCDHGA